MHSSTCSHLDESTVLEAARKVLLLSTSRIKITNFERVNVCIQCGYGGALEALKVTSCMNGNGMHKSCVRFAEPFDIYCFQCGDYQFSSRFDELVGRKRSYQVKPTRKLPSIEEYQERRTDATIKTKGVCNMGSTCFMSSVLQVLMHNKLITNSKHLKFATEECLALNKLDTETRVSTTSNARSSKADKNSTCSPTCAGCICCEFQSLLKEQASADESPLIPSNLLYAVWNYVEYMAGYSQQDAHEFLIAFIDGLDAHLIENHNAKQSTPQSLKSIAKPTLMRGPSLTAEGMLPVENGNGFSLGVPPSSSGSPGGSPRMRSYSPRPMYNFGNVNASNTFLSSNRIAEIFAGTIQSNVICQECGNKSLTYEAFLDLSLSIEEPQMNGGSSSSNGGGYFPRKRSRSTSLADTVSTDDSSVTENITTNGNVAGSSFRPVAVSNGSSAVTLSDCLKFYTSEEKLSEKIKCEHCNDYEFCHKQLSISHAPEVLILHLKRFDILAERKISTKVQFELKNFDISPFLSASQSSSSTQNSSSSPAADLGSSSEGKPRLYDLQGIVSHSGSLNQGHYVSYVLDSSTKNNNHNSVNSNNSGSGSVTSDHQWIRCDDEHITLVSDEDVANVEGYMLFYMKQKHFS